MGVLIPKAKMKVTNVNPRKEGSGDGMVLASDVSVEFAAQRALMDRLIYQQDGKFSDQFFAEDGDTRLESVYPITHRQKIEDLRVSIWLGNKPTVFEGGTLKDGTQMTPDPGGYLTVKGTFQLHPTSAQSGKLDDMVKEYVEIEVETMTDDIFGDGEDGTEPESGAANGGGEE